MRALGNILDAGKFFRKEPVHENEATAGQLGEDCFVQKFAFGAIDVGDTSGLKGQIGDGGDIGKAPVFIVQSGKAKLGEVGEAGVAQRRKPLGLGSSESIIPERFKNPCFAGIFSLAHVFSLKPNRNPFMPWAIVQMKSGGEKGRRGRIAPIFGGFVLRPTWKLRDVQ